MSPTLRRLVINADDFGLSQGVNHGIRDCHERGILTSTSLMVLQPAVKEAALLARDLPRLSVGLHWDLIERQCRNGTWQALYQVVDVQDERAVRIELERQLTRFRQLLGRDPTHLDSHQHVHLQEPVRTHANALASGLGIPLRACTSPFRYCGGFYGQSERGVPFPEALTIAGFRRVISELGSGNHEVSCHPGYGDDIAINTDYRTERALEVAVLCDPLALATVQEAELELCSFAEAPPHKS